MERRDAAALDRWLTTEPEWDEQEWDEYDPLHECGHPASDHPTVVVDGRDQVVCP